MAYSPYRGSMPPFQKSSATSKKAALSVEGKHLAIRERIWAWVRERALEGATREEIALGMDIRIQTVCGAVAKLIDIGRLRETTETRLTTAKRAAQVVIVIAPEKERQGELFMALPTPRKWNHQ